MQISKHFTLAELTKSGAATRAGIDNSASPEIQVNLKRLCEDMLEPIRDLVGKPITINSAYRNEWVNRLVGGQPNSQHKDGCAADITVEGITPDELVKLIVGADLPYDQIILEFDSWVHVSVPTDKANKPRKMKLIIDKHGKRPYV